MNKIIGWTIILLVWLGCYFATVKIIDHFHLIERPLSDFGIEVE